VYSLVIFFLVILGALLSGTILAYPLYLLLSVFTRVPFSDAVLYSTQFCGLIYSLFYLNYVDNLNLSSLGLSPVVKQRVGTLGLAFFCGFMIVALLALTLILFSVYGYHPGREITVASTARLLISAIATGLAVSIFEETIFRGALLQGLMVKTNTMMAIIATSTVYACVHFIYFQEPLSNINFFSAIGQFIPAYSGIFRLETYDAFGSLFLLGVLLALLRVKTNNIVLCISLHAGLVAGVKVFRFYLVYMPGSEYDFLVSSHDHRLGIIAMLWLGLATGVYYLFIFKDRPAVKYTN
jgi:membrane protease YdiL (CAAX protease family)